MNRSIKDTKTIPVILSKYVNIKAFRAIYLIFLAVHFIKANQVFDGKDFINPRSVIVLDKDLVADIVLEESLDPLKIEHFEGVLTPGFVNVHCHTELSHLKGKIPEKTGLPDFGKQIITLRNNFSKAEIQEHIIEADKEMVRNGIVAVGDISNNTDSFRMKADSRIFYHTFIELLGLNPARAKDAFDSGLKLLGELEQFHLTGSLAAHAPYSTSLELIEMISEKNSFDDLTSAIHNQESGEETRFFMGEENGFNGLYQFLGLDISWFKAPGTSSLKYYSHSLHHQKTILVHNTFTSKEDIDFVKHQNIFWCFCPNANLYIENKLPDFNLFAGEINKICLGTDSLASNHQLDMISEGNLLMKSSQLGFTFLSAITSNPARALGIDDRFGTIQKGKKPGINLIEAKNNQFRFVKKVI